MQQYEMARLAIAEKARSERLYMSFALTLAVLLALGGTALVILGIGDHLDIIVAGTGDLEARFINASPGVALWLTSAAVFILAKPRRLEADIRHGGINRMRFGAADLGSEGETSRLDIKYAQVAEEEPANGEQAHIVETQLQEASKSLGKITRMSEERLIELTERLESYLRREAHIVLKAMGREPAPGGDLTETGSARVYYQRQERPAGERDAD